MRLNNMAEHTGEYTAKYAIKINLFYKTNQSERFKLISFTFQTLHNLLLLI